MTEPQLPFSVFFKPIGSQCNLDCRYCYYWQKHESRRAACMDTDTLKTAIAQHIAAQPEHDRPIDFIWHGGEPLLAGLPFYQAVIDIQQQCLAGLPRKRVIQNTIQTNGTLITRRWAQFFAENNVMVGISLDGPQHLHDRGRMDTDGRSAFERTLRGMDWLKSHHVMFNTLSVINHQTYRFGDEIYAFLKQHGSGYIQFQPCLDHALDQHDTQNWSLTGAQWGTFLCTVFDRWCQDDVGHVYIQFFENCLMILMGYQSQMCHHSVQCGQQLAMESDGTVYSCDHYVYPDSVLGSVPTDSLTSMVNGARQRAFGQAKSATLSAQCQQCDFVMLCQGGCPKYRTAHTHQGEPHNALCAGYQQFFRHALPTLIPMATAMKNGYGAEHYPLFR